MRMHGPICRMLVWAALLVALACPAVHADSGTRAAGFTISSLPTGFSTNLTLAADVQVAPTDVGRQGSVYVAALVGNVFFFMDGNGAWHAWAGGAMPAYYTGVLGTHNVPIVSRTDVSPLGGLDVFVGYGQDEADMLNNAKYSKVLGIPPTTVLLTAARDLIGTWQTRIPTTVYYATDWCGWEPALVASQPWNVSFVITAGADGNHVNVEMRFSTGTFTVINGCPGTGIVPEVSPMFFTGTISSSKLILSSGTQVVGEFNFTTDILTGTFDYSWSMVYAQRDYTATNSLILLRQ